MHIALPHKEDKMEFDSGDSEYDTPPETIGLSEPILSSTRPMTQSHTWAQQLAQSMQQAWIEQSNMFK